MKNLLLSAVLLSTCATSFAMPGFIRPALISLHLVTPTRTERAKAAVQNAKSTVVNTVLDAKDTVTETAVSAYNAVNMKNVKSAFSAKTWKANFKAAKKATTWKNLKEVASNRRNQVVAGITLGAVAAYMYVTAKPAQKAEPVVAKRTTKVAATSRASRIS